MGGQKGFSFSGFLTAAVVVIIAAVLLVKFIPIYTEYHAIRKDMKEIVNNPDLANASGPEIRYAFSKKAVVDDIKSVNAEDLDIARDPLRLHVKYEVRVPLFAGLGVYADLDIKAARGVQ